MYSTSCILSVLATASTVIAALYQLGTANTASNGVNSTSTQKPPKAVYLMTNEASGNSIVGLKVAADGSLTAGSLTPTGGKGASGIDGSTNQTAAPDALFSQSAIKVEGDMMVAVNAGSNTITMMTILPKTPRN